MEKVYKTMSRTGVSNIVIGCIILAAGISVGVMAIISGAMLLKRKSDITF